MKEKRLIKFVWKEEKGAIEGLPLYLLIMVVIAAVGIGIVMYWLSTVKKMGPKMIGSVIVSPDSIDIYDAYTGNTKCGDNNFGRGTAFTVTVVVKDADGKGLSGATVRLVGEKLTDDGTIPMGTTDKEGKKTFSIKVLDHYGDSTGEITVEAHKSGYTDAATQTKIFVAPKGADTKESGVASCT